MVCSMVEVTTKRTARQTLECLAYSDLAYLCGIFRLRAGGGKRGMILRLLSQEEHRIERVLVFARLIQLGHYAEVQIEKKALRDLLAKNHLPISGNRHRLYLQLIENGKLSVSEILGLMNTRGLRNVYNELFDKPALDPEYALKNEIENWVNEEPPAEQPPRKGFSSDVWQHAPGDTHPTYGPWGIPHTRTVSTVSGERDDTVAKVEASRAKEFDVAISYASEDTDVAKHLAERLKKEQISVFFDEFFKADMWGKSLSTRFKETYGANTAFVLVLVSKHYVVKDWTDFEFSIARGEARTREEEFILPVRLDDTLMAGLKSDVCYMDLRKDRIDGIVRDFKKKLENRRKSRGAAKVDLLRRLIPRLS